MASAPQMRVGPVPAGAPKPAVVEGQAADLFAQMLGLVPEGTAEPDAVPGDSAAPVTLEGEGVEAPEAPALPPELVLFTPPPAALTAVPPAAAAPSAELPVAEPTKTTRELPQPVASVGGHEAAKTAQPPLAAAPTQARWIELRKALEAQHPAPEVPDSPSPQPASVAAPALSAAPKISEAVAREGEPAGELLRIVKDAARAKVHVQTPVARVVEQVAPAQQRAPARSAALPLVEAHAAAEAPSTPAPTLPEAASTAAALPVTPAAAPAPATASAAAIAAPVANPATDMLGRQLDLAAGAEWLDQLARDIAATGGSEGPMRFRLNPEHLGALKVEIEQGQDGANIRFTTETETARQMLADAQPRLLAEARAQGVRVAEAHVDLGNTGHEGGSSADPRRQDERQEPYFRTGGRPADDQPTAPTRSRSDRYA